MPAGVGAVYDDEVRCPGKLRIPAFQQEGRRPLGGHATGALYARIAGIARQSRGKACAGDDRVATHTHGGDVGKHPQIRLLGMLPEFEIVAPHLRGGESRPCRLE